MYCRYCGTQLADGTAFCIKCGKKTVRLRPRSTAVEAPPPVQPAIQPVSAFSLWLEKVKAAVSANAPRVVAALKKAVSAVKPAWERIFAFTHGFDAVMWAVCGVFLGLELVALLEIIASATESRLLFPFLKEMNIVLLIAWLVCLIIAHATHIIGYNYRISDEYQQALLSSQPLPDADQMDVQMNAPLFEEAVLHGDEALLPGVPDEAAQPEEELRISDEAADIIAELKKLSLSL